MKTVLLYSGGMDSAALRFLHMPDVLLYVDLGTEYSSWERSHLPAGTIILELKQEGKENDGNPQVKNKIRQKQRELSQKASVNNVPKADFVVMNPTHFAVAIKYDEKTMRAPQVISKGADLLAMKIRDVAKNHSIPVLQSPMLARALYANAELEQDIPSALYTAVAQVLAYVYRLRAALKDQGPMPGDVPQPFVPPELDPHSKTLKVVEA